MHALGFRILIAVGYTMAGVVLLVVMPFDFSPWWKESWSHFGWLLLWVAVGAAVDPFRFFSESLPTRSYQNALGRLLCRWPILVFALLILSPMIAWAVGFWWFFPWLPWWSEASYWATREIVLGFLFAVSVHHIWARLAFGRQVCLLVGLLILHHVVLLLAYAGISGTPRYLQDGATQDCFLMQLWFMLLVGILAFTSVKILTRKRATPDV